MIQGEKVILKMLGACHSTEGIYTAWRYGYLYLTHKRLFLYHQDFGEVFFETPMEKIRGLVLGEREESIENKVREELCLLLEGNSVCRLTALDVRKLKEALEKRIREAGGELQKDPGALLAQDAAPTFVNKGEQIICRGKMWHLHERDDVADDTWRPGYLYLTDKRLCWIENLSRKVEKEILVKEIMGAVVEKRLTKEKVMDILYAANGTRRVVTFSGGLLEEWHQALNAVMAGKAGSPAGNVTETCPQCGKTAPAKGLLNNGCAACGWTSPLKKEKIHAIEIPA